MLTKLYINCEVYVSDLLALCLCSAGGNVFCIKIWGKKSAPFMQSLYFAFGIGAFMAPLIAQPFLIDGDVTSDNITRNDHHPVSFKVPSIDSLTSHTRVSRDIASPQVLEHSEPGWKYGRLNDRYLPSKFDLQVLYNKTRQDLMINKISHTVPMWVVSLIFKDGSLPFEEHADKQKLNSFSASRVRRQNSNFTYGGVNLENGTQPMSSSTHSPGSTGSPALTVNQPKKPDSDGKYLGWDTAGGTDTDSKIKNLKHNPITQKPEAKVTTESVVSTAGYNLNITFEAEGPGDMENETREWDSTGDNVFSLTTAASAKHVSTLPTTELKIAAAAATTTSVSTPAAATTITPSKTTSPTASSVLIPTSMETLAPITGMKALGDVTANSSINWATVTKPETSDDFLSNMAATLTEMSKIQFAYLIIGLLLALNAVLFLFLYCKDRLLRSPFYARQSRDRVREPDTIYFIVSLHILLFCFFQAYMGLEVTFGGLLATFAVNHPKYLWTHAKAAAVTSLFWGCLALGRGFAIFIARRFKPSCMMVSSLCLTVLGALILSYGTPVSPATLWVGTVILGLGMSSVFPTTISWVDSYYPLSGTATALFVAGSAVGEMTVPVLTGYLYENVKHMVLMYMTLSLSVLLCLLYLGVQLMVYKKGKSNARRTRSGFMRLHNVDNATGDTDQDCIDVAEGNLGVTETISRRRIQREEELNGRGDNTAQFLKLI